MDASPVAPVSGAGGSFTEREAKVGACFECGHAVDLHPLDEAADPYLVCSGSGTCGCKRLRQALPVEDDPTMGGWVDYRDPDRNRVLVGGEWVSLRSDIDSSM